ncbi:hypothetical protein L3Q82_003997 [Scortum barcoo]|uniref:Uncharacterized protein n=1 Tax=Scortum barcoo TaxID=214431 RepID=A0ACB8X6U8_9TELE|nr:hypothetical protein L3Q82_003997 [Scortum barcoo]
MNEKDSCGVVLSFKNNSSALLTKNHWSECSCPDKARCGSFSKMTKMLRADMASAQASLGENSLEKDLKCSICIDLYVDPVTTTCGHSFCKKCLHGSYKFNDLQCPLCKQYQSKTPDVNIVLRNIVEQMKKTQKKDDDEYTGAAGEVACDVCTERKLKAKKSCLVCLASYCPTHLENHSSTGRLKGHKLVEPVENLDERACLKHGRPLELYSKKLERCICVRCMEECQEEVVSTEEEWNKKKAKLENTKTELKQKIEKRKTRVDEIKTSLKRCTDQIENEWWDVEEVFNAVIATVEMAHATALQPLKDKRRALEEEAKDLKDKLEADINELEKTISELDDISSLEDHILFLQSYPTLKEPDSSKDWTEVEIDTSLSFGTMRKTTTTLLEQIQQELEKLTSIEIERVRKFAGESIGQGASSYSNPANSDPTSGERQEGSKLTTGEKVGQAAFNNHVPSSSCPTKGKIQGGSDIITALCKSDQHQENRSRRERPTSPTLATAVQPKVKDLAQMFSAITAQETAAEPKRKHTEEQKLSQVVEPSAVKHLAQNLSAITAQETAVKPKEKDRELQKPPQVKELARMFSAATTQEAAVRPKGKHPDEQKPTQLKLFAQKLSATTAQKTAVQPKEKDKEVQKPPQTLKTSDMSYQVCHCGWSKVTTYQGLRTHQGKMGCTAKGMRIPESEQFRANHYLPKFTYIVPPIEVEEPFMNILTSYIKSVFGTQQQSHQTTANLDKTQAFDLSTGGQQPLTMTPVSQTHSTQLNPAATEVKVMETNTSLFGTQPAANLDKTYQTFDFSTGGQQTFNTQANPATAEVKVMETNTSPVFGTQQRSTQPAANLDKTHQTFDFSSGGQQPFNMMSTFQTFNTQANPAVTEVKVMETNTSLFGTPQRSTQPAANLDKARRALDFSTGALQVGQQTRAPRTTTAQETAVQPKEMEREAEREKERKKEREEVQKQIKAKQNRTRADLQQKIQIREQKMAEVHSSAKACKGKLDAEWLEINSVFSEVTRVVEAARQKALQPLEERRQRVKQDAQNLIQKLQKEIDQLKKTIDDLDKNPDLQVSPQTGLDGWRNVDTSLSFGTLRTTTSNMMEQIHQKLEKLSSVELKRIPKFAVDVKLDPTTAHQCLLLSDDGKKVRDGGKNKAVPDVPQRFSVFGSILGLNRLTSGKSYWEVEVGNKTGWDLGVARRSANRKGELTLNPDNGYWATVHYEDDKYAALSTPPVCLPLAVKPQKVGVFVDYEEGLVSFYNVTAQSHIYSFTECSFNDEIFPYFSPHLKQNEKNSAPLIISPVKKQ